MEWLLTHEPEADSNGAVEYSVDAVQSLESMGFSSEQAKAALSACQGSLERAVDWLFSHADSMEATVSPDSPKLDGRGEYELVGFLSHMGKNPSCGHYVCHAKKVRCICVPCYSIGVLVTCQFIQCAGRKMDHFQRRESGIVRKSAL